MLLEQTLLAYNTDVDAHKQAKAKEAKDGGEKKQGGGKTQMVRDKHGKPKLVQKKAEHNPMADEMEELQKIWEENVETRRTCGSVSLVMLAIIIVLRFIPHCFGLAQQLSEPQIMLRGRGQGGESIIIDDFREAYWWLRDRTPEDARVMAWWDYGYQINGVGQRTSIADGNTWNHEHIALLGKCLTSPENQSHAIVRHLADYVLIWTTRCAAGSHFSRPPPGRGPQPLNGPALLQ